MAVVAATAATATTFFARASFVNNQVLSQEIESVQFIDSITASGVIGHFNKSKATATLCYFVHDDFRRAYFTVLGK